MYSCQICGREEKRRQNLGVKACRACAAFYRRTIVENLSYTCKYTGKCEITSSAKREKCRACRLRRCYDAGMTMDSLKLVAYNDLPDLPSISKEIMIQEPYPMLCWASKGIKKFFELQKERIISVDPEYALLGTNPNNRYKSMKILDYKLFDLLTVPITYSMLYEFYENFDKLDYGQKGLFICTENGTGFYPQFRTLLIAFLSAKHFPDLDDGRLLMYYGCVLDTDLYVENEFKMSDKHSEHYKFLVLVFNLWKGLANKFRLRNILEIEFIFLIYLIFINESSNFPDLKTHLSRQKSSLFDEIYTYYHANYEPEIVAIRFGNLFSTYNDLYDTTVKVYEASLFAFMFIENHGNLWAALDKECAKRLYKSSKLEDGNTFITNVYDKIIHRDSIKPKALFGFSSFV